MNFIQRLIIITLLSLLLAASFPLCPAAQNTNFVIQAYDINMQVQDDNSYLITETINVLFNVDQRGIIRTIPLNTYRGDAAQITDVSVNGHPFETSREGGDLRIRIGDPDRYASPQEQYRISYRYAIGDDGLNDMDELYVNLIGLDWDVNIEEVTFTIVMPAAFDPSPLNFTYGRAGSTENERVDYQVAGTTITGSLPGGLGPHEALTVALPLPEGYFINAKPLFSWSRLITNFFYVPIGLLLLMALGVKRLWGSNRQLFPTVEFYPPEGLTSADIGYMFDGRVNPRDITSLIIYWADKGLLEIEEKTVESGRLIRKEKKELYLYKLKDPGPESAPYEQVMFQELFDLFGSRGYVEVSTLSKRFYITVEKVRRQIRDVWHNNKELRIFHKKGTFAGVLLKVLSLLTFSLITYVIMADVTGDNGFQSLAIGLGLSFFAMLLIWPTTSFLANWQQLLPKQRIKPAFFGFLKFIIILGFLAFAAPSGTRFLAIVCFGLSLGMSYLSNTCHVRTALGDQYMEKITGFREFIFHGEKDRIEMLAEEDPSYYYHVLPFALVLNVADTWAKKFDNIALPPPGWYKTDNPQIFASSTAFAATLSTNLNVLTDTMASAPASSGSGGSGGSSGGGSSGGGSGGGGGSSW